MYLATSDAGVACWDAKYIFNFWRPQTAIQNGDADGNDDTLGDPGWQPLFPTPQHPDYVSGHATNSSAMATALRLLFGDDPGVLIVATSPTNAGFERRWTTVERRRGRGDRCTCLFGHPLPDIRRGRRAAGPPGRQVRCQSRVATEEGQGGLTAHASVGGVEVARRAWYPI